ncbi:tail fiber assembly protein [Enterobacter hormaechei]
MIKLTNEEGNYYFSAVNGGFYLSSLRANYENAGTWPDDALPISDRWYRYLINGQTMGKIIAANEYGQPILQAIKVDYPAVAKDQKGQLIIDAMQSVSVIQLKLQAGRTLSASESEKLNRTLDYIDDVESTPIESVTGLVDWPLQPE